MAISSTKINGKPGAPEWPRLMVGTFGNVVLFTAEGQGVCIHGEGDAAALVGVHKTNWYFPEYKEFTGAITLGNK